MPVLKVKCKVNLHILNTAKFNEAILISSDASAKLYEASVRKIIKDVLGRQYATLAELRGMGHPYGRGTIKATRTGIVPTRQAPPMPVGYINTHAGQGSKIGDLYGALDSETSINGSRIKVKIWFDGVEDLERILQSGTPTMVPRPYATLIRMRIRDEVTNRVGNFWRTQLKTSLLAVPGFKGNK